MKTDQPELFDRLPDAVLFDLDDTLYDYGLAHDAAMLAIDGKLREFLKLTSHQIRIAYDKARNEVKARLGHTASSHSRLLYFQTMMEGLGLRNDVLLFLELEHIYWRTFLANSALHPFVDDTLNELRSRRIPIAIVTDLTAQIQFRKIAHLRLDRYVDFVVTSEEAGANKVSLKPFALAITKLGLEDAPRLWVIGDDVGDMAAAELSPNIVTMQFLTSRSKPLPHHASFSSFRDLLQMISRLPPAP